MILYGNQVLNLPLLLLQSDRGVFQGKLLSLELEPDSLRNGVPILHIESQQIGLALSEGTAEQILGFWLVSLNDVLFVELEENLLNGEGGMRSEVEQLDDQIGHLPFHQGHQDFVHVVSHLLQRKCFLHQMVYLDVEELEPEQTYQEEIESVARKLVRKLLLPMLGALVLEGFES